jgi:hypothetical protein
MPLTAVVIACCVERVRLLARDDSRSCPPVADV